MPRVCGKRRREQVDEVTTAPKANQKTSSKSNTKHGDAKQAAQLPLHNSEESPAALTTTTAQDTAPALLVKQADDSVSRPQAPATDIFDETPHPGINKNSAKDTESSEATLHSPRKRDSEIIEQEPEVLDAGMCSSMLPAESQKELHARWWLQANIRGAKVRAMLDSGATHTVMGPLGLQIASECGNRVTPTFDAQAKTFNGQTESIIGRVELPIIVAGVSRSLNVAIVNRLDGDCVLGADFYCEFNAVVHPRENKLQIEGTNDKITLEAAASATSAGVCSLEVGLAEISEQQREELRLLVDRIFSDGGCID